jgi:hypothetical protein
MCTGFVVDLCRLNSVKMVRADVRAEIIDETGQPLRSHPPVTAFQSEAGGGHEASSDTAWVSVSRSDYLQVGELKAYGLGGKRTALASSKLSGFEAKVSAS